MSQSLDEAIQMQAQASQQLATSLADIPGGRDLVEWFEGAPEFGDSEIVALVLDRKGPSRLSIALDCRGKRAVVNVEMAAWIDVDMRGFSGQNVIGGLSLRQAEEREIKTLGTRCQMPAGRVAD